VALDDSHDSFQQQLEARVGKTLCNKYTLEKLLGVGGMASVYRGTHRNGNRVAVKILHPHLAISKEINERFLREGYVANKVDHDGAVRVLDDDCDANGAPFLVMELLDGDNLEDHIQSCGGTLSPREIVPLVCELLEVLSAAHEKGIVHRDIKPENLFVTRKEKKLKVLDFGIARLADGARQATRTGRVMGTPVYMAPEQARGEMKLIDGQTDVWAAGAILFRALTGRFVHEAETPELVLVSAATQEARRLAQLVPAVDAELAEIVDRGLAWKKDARWKTADAMRTALRSLPIEKLSTNRVSIGGVAKTVSMTEPLPAKAVLEGVAATEIASTPHLLAAAAATPAPAPSSREVSRAPLQSTTAGISSAPRDATLRARGPSRLALAAVAIGLLGLGGVVTAAVLSMRPNAGGTTGAPSAVSASTEPSAGAPSLQPASSIAAFASATAAAPSGLPAPSTTAAASSPTRTPAGATLANGPRAPLPGNQVATAAKATAPATPSAAAPAASVCEPKKVLVDGNWLWKMECRPR